jgi:hypothetical protein
MWHPSHSNSAMASVDKTVQRIQNDIVQNEYFTDNEKADLPELEISFTAHK